MGGIIVYKSVDQFLLYLDIEVLRSTLDSSALTYQEIDHGC